MTNIINDLEIYVVPFDAEEHNDLIKTFDCGEASINNCIHNVHEFDATAVLFFNANNDDLIGFCSYCCSSIRIAEDIESYECYPAMEIKLFGISTEYQGHKFYVDDSLESISLFVFKYMLGLLKSISDNYIYASYITLFALPWVTGFYEKLKFDCLSENEEVLQGDFSEGCVPMYLPI